MTAHLLFDLWPFECFLDPATADGNRKNCQPTTVLVLRAVVELNASTALGVFSLPAMSKVSCLYGCLTLYHTIPTFIDPKEKAF